MVFEVSIKGLNEFASGFWNLVKDAKLFAFHGEMGSGKTTLITSLCKAKGVKELISSPTYSIINEYRSFENNIEKKIYHLDLYRLNSMDEIIQAGVEDCIYSGEICFIEWPEKIPEFLNENTIKVFLEIIDGNTRQVKIQMPTASLQCME